MIGRPESWAWWLACLFGDESQQAIKPHVWHIRRWSQRPPLSKQGAQPTISPDGSSSNTWSRCEQAVTGIV